ncbi:MAG: hypothetical protein ACRDZU_01900 [Acidimicrobiales bacterium]
MAMITQTRPAETTPQVASPPEPVTGLGGMLGWVAVVLAVVAATVLGVRALSGSDPAAPQPWYSVERGSIAAIDHTADAPVRDRQFSVDRGSVTAIDHAAATPGSSVVSAERGSITAIDHAATPSAARQWYSVERGGVSAIDQQTAESSSAAE